MLTTAPKGYKVSTNGRSLDILSRQWFARPADDKYLTIDSLVAEARRRAEETEEIRLKNNQLEAIAPEILASDSRDDMLRKNQQLLLGLPGGKTVAPTHWAFGQAAGLARAPAAYLRTLPSPLVADALSYGLRYNRDTEEVKLFADEAQALAVTGPDYGRIFNWEVAEAVAMATASTTGDHRWKVPGMLDWGTGHYDPNHPVTIDTTTLFMNDRGLFMFLCQDLAPIEIGRLPSGEPDLVFRGFYVTNSEVGHGALKLGAMYLRAICCNRILWGVEAFEELTMRHTKYAPSRFIEEARPALESFANGSTQKLLDGVKAAKDAKIADTRVEAINWLADRNLSRKRALAVFDLIVKEERSGEEDERPMTAWEAAQGITALARNERNHDVRMDLEIEAKRILDKVT